LRKLEEQLAKNKVENLLKQEMAAKMKEEEKRLIKEQELQRAREKNTRRNEVRPAKEPHEDQIIDLHDWIEEQMNKMEKNGSPQAEPPGVTAVKIDKKSTLSSQP
jgi:hypothetical protein